MDSKSKRHLHTNYQFKDMLTLAHFNIRRDKTYDQFYDLDDVIYDGKFSTLNRAFMKHKSTRVTIKLMKTLAIDREIGNRGLEDSHLFNEFSLLNVINHKNIVHVTEAYSSGVSIRSLVFNYTSEVDLDDMTQEPKNWFGMNEHEFFLIMNNLTEAVRELRKRDITHRSIKPENIVQCIEDNGDHVYKLINFDFAVSDIQSKEIECYGTIGYTHPDMLENIKMVHRPEHELFSIGCTLYKAATSYDPFKIDDRDDPQKIEAIKNKPDDCIAFGDKPTVYETEIRGTQIPLQIKPLLVDMLKKLVQTREFWTFEEFFNASDYITSHVFVNVIIVGLHQSFKLALRPEHKLPDLQNLIEKTFNVPIDAQLLVYRYSLLTRYIDATQEAKTYPMINDNNKPILVFSLQDKIILTDYEQLLKNEMCEQLNDETFIEMRFGEHLLHKIQRLIEQFSLIHELIKDTVPFIRNYVKEQWQEKVTDITEIEQIIDRAKTKSMSFEKIYDCIQKLDPTTNVYKDDFNTVDTILNEAHVWKKKLVCHGIFLEEQNLDVHIKSDQIAQYNLHINTLIKKCADLYDEYSSYPAQCDQDEERFFQLKKVKIRSARQLVNEAYHLRNSSFTNYITEYFYKYSEWYNVLVQASSDTMFAQRTLKHCYSGAVTHCDEIMSSIQVKVDFIVEFIKKLDDKDFDEAEIEALLNQISRKKITKTVTVQFGELDKKKPLVPKSHSLDFEIEGCDDEVFEITSAPADVKKATHPLLSPDNRRFTVPSQDNTSLRKSPTRSKNKGVIVAGVSEGEESSGTSDSSANSSPAIQVKDSRNVKGIANTSDDATSGKFTTSDDVYPISSSKTQEKRNKSISSSQTQEKQNIKVRSSDSFSFPADMFNINLKVVSGTEAKNSKKSPNSSGDQNTSADAAGSLENSPKNTLIPTFTQQPPSHLQNLTASTTKISLNKDIFQKSGDSNFLMKAPIIKTGFFKDSHKIILNFSTKVKKNEEDDQL